MMFVVVKQNGVVVGKEAYGGDTAGIQAVLDQRTANDPTLNFEVYDDSGEQTFVDVPMPAPAENLGPLSGLNTSENQADWQTAKAAGTEAALSFIGQKLGLE